MTEHRRKNFFDFRPNGNDQVAGEISLQTCQIRRRNFGPKRRRDEPNNTPTDTPSGEDQEERRITGSTHASPNAVTQDEELRWANLKTVIRGEESTLTYRAARDARKAVDRFVLSENDVLYHLGTRLLRGDHLQENPTLRLVVPTTMIQEVLQTCHDSLEGGHQSIARTFYLVRLDYYWVGLYADAARHVNSCPGCSSSKNPPKFRGYTPGNILVERPFQIVSMDFVIPLPKSQLGNMALCVHLPDS
ncbi:reverse transcriptase [Phytophthora megakarya]|uniref:Reverse transcriptase n=1 Tax=Phytophthora megakarya TaxID=4795 RepID=A0A225WCM4_9STRA|nr:reverse transcriptase [Phytophthora megakarya]